jgi:hypothetical protein
MIPLYEAKLVHHFDHRLACYSKQLPGSRDTELPRLETSEKNDPARSVIPRYWVAVAEIRKRLAGKWDRDWLLGWRDICRSTDERTVIFSAIPFVAAGNTFFLALAKAGVSPRSPSRAIACLQANLSAFVLDYIARQKLAGTHMTYGYFTQLPVLPPTRYEDGIPWDSGQSFVGWNAERVLELSYTSYDMRPFAKDLDDKGEPFRWNGRRRALLRAELDAAYFHLYGIKRDDADYIMETFPIVKRRDKAAFGEYRTKRLILEIYDAMAEAVRTGKPYQTALDPPPGRGPRHPSRTEE